MSRIFDVEVATVMTLNPAAIGGDASIAEAAGAMVEGGFRHLPVVDSDRRVIGILSERDLREKLGVEVERFPHAARELLDERVETAMRPAPITIATTAPLRVVLDILADKRVGVIPVVDEGERLVGIASYFDVLGFLRDQDRAPRRTRPPSGRAARSTGARAHAASRR